MLDLKAMKAVWLRGSYDTGVKPSMNPMTRIIIRLVVADFIASQFDGVVVLCPPHCSERRMFTNVNDLSAYAESYLED